ncbi:MAG: NMP kinase [Thermoplasmata archaeon]|nr:MAG: NMP kinase [Thermoplasmata archaeon]
MRFMKIIAITGTPGVGKSTVASILKSLGHEVYDIEYLARGCGALYSEGMDKVVDVDKLNEKFPELLKNLCQSCDKVFVVGHLSHLLRNADCVIVLRCNPEGLRTRLAERGYPEDKIRANMEAEAIDYIAVEAYEIHGNKVYEIDTTKMPPAEVARAVVAIAEGKGDEFRGLRADWSEVILSWY